MASLATRKGQISRATAFALAALAASERSSATIRRLGDPVRMTARRGAVIATGGDRRGPDVLSPGLSPPKLLLLPRSSTQRSMLANACAAYPVVEIRRLLGQAYDT